MPDGKRHLPVLQSPPPEEEPDRPPWHWAAIGAVATLLAWLPLAMLAQAAAQRLLEPHVRVGAPPPTPRQWLLLGVVSLALHLVPLGIGSLLGGMLVGRFGGAAGKKEATAAGIAAASVALVASLLTGGFGGLLGWLLAAVVLITLAALCARGGAAIGLRLRRR